MQTSTERASQRRLSARACPTWLCVIVALARWLLCQLLLLLAVPTVRLPGEKCAARNPLKSSPNPTQTLLLCNRLRHRGLHRKADSTFVGAQTSAFRIMQSPLSLCSSRPRFTAITVTAPRYERRSGKTLFRLALNEAEGAPSPHTNRHSWQPCGATTQSILVGWI